MARTFDITEQPDPSNQELGPIFPFDGHLKCIRWVWEALQRFQKDHHLIASQLATLNQDNHVTLTLELLWQIQRYDSFVGTLSRALQRHQAKINSASTNSVLPPSSQQRHSMDERKQKRRIRLALLSVMWMRIHCLWVMQADVASSEAHPLHQFSASQRILSTYFSLAPSDYQRTTLRPYLSRLLVTPSGALAYVEAADALRKIWETLRERHTSRAGDQSAASLVKSLPGVLAQVRDVAQALEIPTENSSTVTELIKSCTDSLIQETTDWTQYAHQDAVNLAKQVALLAPQPSVSRTTDSLSPVMAGTQLVTQYAEHKNTKLLNEFASRNDLETFGRNNTTNSTYQLDLQAGLKEPQGKNQSKLHKPIKNLTPSVETTHEPLACSLVLDLQQPLTNNPPNGDECSFSQASDNTMASIDVQATPLLINLDNQLEQIVYPTNDNFHVSPSQRNLGCPNLPSSSGQENNHFTEAQALQPIEQGDDHRSHSESLSISPDKHSDLTNGKVIVSTQSSSLSPQKPPLVHAKDREILVTPLPSNHNIHTESMFAPQMGAHNTNHDPSQQESRPISEAPLKSRQKDDFENRGSLTPPQNDSNPVAQETTSSQGTRHSLHDSPPPSRPEDNSSNQRSLSIQQENNYPRCIEPLLSLQESCAITNFFPPSRKNNSSTDQASLSSPHNEIHPTDQLLSPLQEGNTIQNLSVISDQENISSTREYTPHPPNHRPTEAFHDASIAKTTSPSLLAVKDCLREVAKVIHPPDVDKNHGTMLDPGNKGLSKRVRHSMGPQTLAPAELMRMDESKSKISKRRCQSTTGITQPNKKKRKQNPINESNEELISTKVMAKLNEKFGKNPRLSGAFQQAKEKALKRRSQIIDSEIDVDKESKKSSHSPGGRNPVYPYNEGLCHNNAQANQDELVDDEADLNPCLDSTTLQKLKDNAASFPTERSFFANMMNHFFGTKKQF